MTDSADDRLDVRIEQAVLAVAGVTAMYPVRPHLTQVGDVLRDVVGRRTTDLPRVAIDADRVRVSIGTDEVFDTRAVVHAVQTAVGALLRDAGRPDGVEVRVARIG